MGTLIDGRLLSTATPPPAEAAFVAPTAPMIGRGNDGALPDARTWNALLGAPALSASEVSALNLIARPRFAPQGAELFAQGEQAASLVFVRDGDAALGHCTVDGQFRIERPVHGPGWLDQSAAWADATRPVDARAVTPVVVIELPLEELQALLPTQPMLARRLIASLSREVLSLTVNTQGLRHKDAPGRLAQWLLEHCQPVPDNPHRGVVKLGERKRDIASQLAITPETLSRLMRTLSRQGLISVSGYTVHVVDLDGLRVVAKGR